VLSPQEQTGYIILAIALVALLWFLTAFVRAMLIILITGGLSLFWAYWIHMFWPQPVPVAFFAALIVATIVVGVKPADGELNPKKPSSGAHSH
jgi:membrane protein implicated in regulation of membrane protease activity